jgi:hypothetical protein
MTSEQKAAAEANATADNPTGSSSTEESGGGLDVVETLKSLLGNSSVNAGKKAENTEALDNPTDVITNTTSKNSSYRQKSGDTSPGYSLLADLKLTDGGTETKTTDSATGQQQTQEERTAKSGISVAGNVSVNLSDDELKFSWVIPMLQKPAPSLLKI